MAGKERERARLAGPFARVGREEASLLVGDDARGPLRKVDVGRPGQVEADAAQRELRERDVLHAAQAVEIELQLGAAALELERCLQTAWKSSPSWLA